MTGSPKSMRLRRVVLFVSLVASQLGVGPLDVPVADALVARTIEPSLVDFGQEQIGVLSGSRDVTITNTGDEPLEVQDHELAGPDWVLFSVIDDTCLGSVLAPGEQCVLSVGFNAEAVGVYEAELRIFDDIDAPDITQGVPVKLSAIVVEPGRAFVEGEVGDVLIGTEHFSDPTVPVAGDASAVTIGVHHFEVEFRPPAGLNLAPGVYNNATTYDGVAGQEPNLTIVDPSALCATGTGRFFIDDVAFGVDGRVSRFAARWEYHCNGAEAASHGAVNFQSDAPYSDRTVDAWSFRLTETADGVSPTEHITIRNAGPDELDISMARFAGKGAASFFFEDDQCSNSTLVAGATCDISIFYQSDEAAVGLGDDARLLIFDDIVPYDGISDGRHIELYGRRHGTDLADGEFHPLPPYRLLDTRELAGGDGDPVGPGETITIQVAGRGGVPAEGVRTVVLNATAVGATAPTFVSILSSDSTHVGVSNLNPELGGITANMVTVEVGSDGAIEAFNLDGDTHLLLDLVGYYSDRFGPRGSVFHPVDPLRVIDTRFPDSDGNVRPLEPDSVVGIDFSILNRFGIIDYPISAIVANVTITEPTAPSFLTAFPPSESIPTASHVNFLPGQTVPNLVTVQVDNQGYAGFYNLAGTPHLIIDVVGYYTNERSSAGGRFQSLGAQRLWDTRWRPQAIGPEEVFSLQVNVPDDALAIVTNLTVTEPTDPSFLTLFPDDLCQIPNASNINFLPGQTAANSAIVRVGSEGGCELGPNRLAVFNPFGTTHFIVDLFGYFI